MQFEQIEHIEIRAIKFGSSEYKAGLTLRNEVLRLPLGLILSEKDTSTDTTDVHFGAFIDSKLVGCLMLRANSPTQVQMRQVAVDPGFHGKGIGRKLVEAFEKRAREIGAREVVMDARQTARNFYEKLGYSTTSDQYIQSTIPHFKMCKAL
jgi:predicted GNAT family N-acyltransferase